jgi:hypothetical protein
MAEPLNLEPIAFRDAAYGLDLAAPAALLQDYHGQCVWDRRALLTEVKRLRNTEAWDEVERLRGVIDRLQVEKHDLIERLMRAGSDPT